MLYTHTHHLRASRPPVEIRQYVEDFEQAKAVCRWLNSFVPQVKRSANFTNPFWEEGDRAMSLTLTQPTGGFVLVAVGDYVYFEDGRFYTVSAERLASHFAPVPASPPLPA